MKLSILLLLLRLLFQPSFHAYTYVAQFIHRLHCQSSPWNKRIGLQDRTDTGIIIQKTSTSETKLCRIDHLAFPNSQVTPLSISHTTRVTKTTNIGLKNTFTSTSGTRRLSVLVISYQGELFVPFPQSLNILFKNLSFVEYLSFRLGDEGIQTILLLGYRFCGWFTSSYCFYFVLSW